MNIGFIGCGNMATALIKGLINSKFAAQPSDILAFDIDEEVLDNLVKNLGVTPCKSHQNLVDYSDFIVLAVKTNQAESVLSKLNFKGKVLISVIASTTIEQLRSMIKNKDNISIVRVMPNINVAVGAGMTAICPNNHIKENELKYVLDMFSSLGEVAEIIEKDFSAFTAIAGSSPAFTYLYIDSLARAALKAGMSKTEADKIAAQAVLGSAKKLLETNESPWTLVDKVCSPGGSSIAGICELENNKFISTVIKGIDAVIAHDKETMNR